jgi:hypothetical protein
VIGVRKLRTVKFRWVTLVCALVASAAFALSVQGGKWWSVGGVAIGPLGSRHCFGGECRSSGLGWIGGTDRWVRTGVGAWAAALLAMLLLLMVAAAVAAGRVPKLVAKSALVAIGTAAITGTLFVVQFPDADVDVHMDRGLLLFVVGIVAGVAAGVLVLRAVKPADPR